MTDISPVLHADIESDQARATVINVDTLERRRLFGTLHVAYSYMSASQSEWPSPPPTVFGIVIPKLVALSGLMNNTASAMFFTSWFAASLSCCLYIKLAFAVGYLLHYNLYYVTSYLGNFFLA